MRIYRSDSFAVCCEGTRIDLKVLMNSLWVIIDEIPTAPPSGINQLKWKLVKELQVAI